MSKITRSRGNEHSPKAAVYRSLIEQSKDGIALCEENGVMIVWNAAMEAITGLPAEAILDKKVWEMQFATLPKDEQTPQKFEELKTSLSRFLKSGKAPWADQLISREYQRPDGKILWIEGKVFSIQTGDGFMLASISRDVSRFARTEQKHQTILQSARDAYFLVDLRGRITEVNQAACEISGYSEAELLGMTIMDIEGRMSPRRVLETIKLMVTRGSGYFESSLKRKDGSLVPINLSIGYSKVDGGRLVAFARDLRDVRRTEASLEENRKQLMDAQRIAHLGSWTYFSNTGYSIWSDEMWRLFYQQPRQEQIGVEEFFDMLHPEDVDAVKAAYQEMITHPRAVSLQMRTHPSLGPQRYLIIRAEPGELGEDGYVIAGTMQDITERVLSEEALRQSEEKFSKAFQIAPLLMSITRLSDGQIINANQNFSELIGYPAEEIIGRTPEEINLWVDFSERAALIDQLRKDGIVEGMQTRINTRQGEIRDVLISARSLLIQETTCLLIAGMDITKRKYDEYLIQLRAQELAALNMFSKRISRTLSVEQVAAEAVRGVLDVTQAGVSFLLMRKGDDLIPAQIEFADPENEVDEFPTHKLGACLCGMAVTERRPIYSADIYNDMRCTWEECKQAGLKSAAVLPLFRGEDVFAVLGLGAAEKRDFGEQAEFLETLAGEVATGLQNALLFEAEAQRRLEAESLRQATASLTTSLKLNQVLEDILDGLAAVVSYDSASVFMFEEGGQRVIAGRGYPKPEELIGQVFPITDIFTPQVIDTRQPIIIPDAADHPDFNQWGGVDYIRGWMMIPLVVRGEVVGRLSIDSRTVDAFSHTHAELAMAFANQAAIAIDNARLFERTQEHADLLEERVEERTAELQKVINLMAGREVRMAELKKVIKKLRAQIEDAGMTPVADDPLLGDPLQNHK